MRSRFVLSLVLPVLLTIGTRTLIAQAPASGPDQNPEGTTGALKTNITTGCGYSAHSGNGSRSVTDLHVPGALGVYGLDFTRHWNSRPAWADNEDASFSADFGSSSWRHSWRWDAVYGEEPWVAVDPRNPDGGEYIFYSRITVTFPDGHANRYQITRSNHYTGYHPNGVEANPRCGPPYLQPEVDASWTSVGGASRDFLRDMALDGSSFWLHLADGGAVHFEGYVLYPGFTAYVWWGYQATEIIDPHGLKTTLTYYPPIGGTLVEVKQDGGRLLKITNKHIAGFTAGVIASVETGGPAGVQRVDYNYKRYPNSSDVVLGTVTYQDDPAPGQTVSAVYAYNNCFLDNVCIPYVIPRLKLADDPRFDGPMTKIRYDYVGINCPRIPITYPEPYEGAHFDHFYSTLYSIAAEKSYDNQTVAAFGINCYSGTRNDRNGLGGYRKLFFGRSAGDFGDFRCNGYQLAKITDFHTSPEIPASVPYQRQNYNGAFPCQTRDGRGIVTKEIITPGDASGFPGEIDYADGSKCFYDRINPGNSELQNYSLNPNRNKLFLFKKTDERNKTTVYTRDSRRRITRIDYPDDGSWEGYTYTNLNQVLTHRLPSGVTENYQYNSLNQLWKTWNSETGENVYTEYLYDSLERVSTVIMPLARFKNTFTAKMEYNGRHKVTKLTYPSVVVGGSDPFITYEYDKYGNCTAITNELGQRSAYTYDDYRRCTSYTEPLNAPGWDGGSNVASRRWDWFYDRVMDGATAGATPIPASAHTSKEWRIQIEPVFNAAGDRRATARTFDVNNRIMSEGTGFVQRNGYALGTLVSVPETAMNRFTYDENGQKKSYTDPMGRLTTYDYDNRNRLWKTNETVNTMARTTETRYDRTGNKIWVKFPDDKTQEWTDHTAFGQPRHFIDERTNITDMEYWEWGPMKKLKQVTTHRSKDGGGTEDQPTTFFYDEMGRLIKTKFPDDTYEQTVYTFGQPTVWRTRKTWTKRLNYDARGRESSHTWDASAAPGVTRTWDNANRLSTISNSFSTISYAYDDAGQMKTETTNVQGSGAAKTVGYFRYPSGDVSKLAYPDGSTVQRNYTPRGQLQGIGWEGLRSMSYAYLPDGKVDYQAYTAPLHTKFEYNGRGMIESVRHKNTGTGRNLAFRQYGRDTRDRIVWWKRGTDNLYNGMEDGRGDRYSYDAEGQLTEAWYRAANPDSSPSQPKRGDTFHYDELGNRMDANLLASRGSVTFPRRDNGLNQYSGWTPISNIYHDDNVPLPSPAPSPWRWGPPGNGVLMQDGWITASYNALNQPVAMWAPGYGGNFRWFGYDPLGRCVKRWTGPDNTLQQTQIRQPIITTTGGI